MDWIACCSNLGNPASGLGRYTKGRWDVSFFPLHGPTIIILRKSNALIYTT